MARKSIAWTALCACLFGTAAEASTWRLRVFNVDDRMDVMLNGILRLSCNYGQTCDIDLTNFMTSGTNNLILQVTNTAFGGFTYGYVLAKDSAIYSQEVCGMQAYVGCSNNDGTQGVVHRVFFKLTK